MPLPTVRAVLTAKIQRLQQKKQQAVATAQECQVQIDVLRDLRDNLTPGEETKLAELQTLSVIKAED